MFQPPEDVSCMLYIKGLGACNFVLVVRCICLRRKQGQQQYQKLLGQLHVGLRLKQAEEFAAE
jgi:hypothetical protein